MKEKLVNIGSAGAAFLASLCCIGPIMLAGLGLGGAGLVTGLEAYRPYMMGVTFIFLGAAFFMTYRKHEEVCEDGTCKVRRGSKGNQITLWTVTVLALLFLAFPYIPWGNVSVAPAGTGDNLTQTALSVEGMSCASCNVGVEIAVNKLNGIYLVKADYETGTAFVEFDPNKVEVKEIVGAINHLGYTAKLTEKN